MTFCRQSQVIAQVKALNDAFSTGGIIWSLKQTTHTLNATWFDDTAKASDMMRALRQGGAGDLNVYTVGFVIKPLFHLAPSEILLSALQITRII